MTQASLLDGATLKELGISRAEAASKGWQDAARGAIRLVSLIKPEFTAEDVEELVGPSPSPGGMGAAFRRAHQAKEILPLGYRQSLKPSRHRAIVRVWTASQARYSHSGPQEPLSRTFKGRVPSGEKAPYRADSGPNGEEVAS